MQVPSRGVTSKSPFLMMMVAPAPYWQPGKDSDEGEESNTWRGGVSPPARWPGAAWPPAGPRRWAANQSFLFSSLPLMFRSYFPEEGSKGSGGSWLMEEVEGLCPPPGCSPALGDKGKLGDLQPSQVAQVSQLLCGRRSPTALKWPPTGVWAVSGGP